MEKLIKCKDCRFIREKHYESGGEKPYIKTVCGNRFGLNNDYTVRGDDFCSRAEPKEHNNKLTESVTGFIVGGCYINANGVMFITLDTSCGEDTRLLHLRLIGTKTIIEEIPKFILDGGLAVAFIGEWENEDKHIMNVHKLLLGKTPHYTNGKLKCQVTDTVNTRDVMW